METAGKSIVLTTCESEQQAQRIARLLVERELAACVNINGPIRSVYRWQGAIEESSEYLLVIKTEDRLTDEVRKAIDVMSKIWLNDKYVQGGKAKIVTTNFGDAPAGMFQTPPKCWLHKQGNFIMAFFPKTAKALTDYDFFYLPPIDSAQGKPFLVAGDLMAATNDKPATKAVMQWFSTGDGVKGWLAAGGALGPQKDVCLDWYGDPVEKKIAGIYQGSTVVRFDGSDLMPGKVGAGSFWKGMTDWLSGAAPLDTVLKEIDASWPR